MAEAFLATVCNQRRADGGMLEDADERRKQNIIAHFGNDRKGTPIPVGFFPRSIRPWRSGSTLFTDISGNPLTVSGMM